MAQAPLDTTAPVLLVVRALGLGDFCASVPALKGLRRRFPRHELVLVTSAPLAGLARSVGVDLVLPLDWTAEAASNPHRDAERIADEFLAARATGGVEAAGLSEHGRLEHDLREPHLVVNLHGPGPQSLDFARRISERLGDHGRPCRLLSFALSERIQRDTNDQVIEVLLTWESSANEYVRWCRLLECWSIDADPTDLSIGLAAISNDSEFVARGDSAIRRPEGPHLERQSSSSGPCIVVHPGASSVARRWPTDRFAALVDQLAAAKEAWSNMSVLVTGSAAEFEICRDVVEQSRLPRNRLHNLAGSMDLCELARTFASADLVIANDSGPAHLAWAMGVPSVVLYGPTAPAQWGYPASAHQELARKGPSNRDPLDEDPSHKHPSNQDPVNRDPLNQDPSRSAAAAEKDTELHDAIAAQGDTLRVSEIDTPATDDGARRAFPIELWCGRTGDPHASTTDAGLLEITVADVLGAIAGIAGWTQPGPSWVFEPGLGDRAGT